MLDEVYAVFPKKDLWEHRNSTVKHFKAARSVACYMLGRQIGEYVILKLDNNAAPRVVIPKTSEVTELEKELENA
jgi:hypothetical protein